MPGITGIISRQPTAECERAVKVMVATLRHESFHASGTFSAPELGVFTGWVAHENSFADKQVFFNENQDIALIFSGECFVEPETRNRLKQSGHSFGAGGECLVHLYEELGENFFETLNGLFSGLLVDRRRNKVFLFNDRFGMERIYWHATADAFYFASEAKALLRILPELRGFDADGLKEFLTFGCTLDWKTMFRGIELLPGGSCWTFEKGGSRREKYFSPERWEAQPMISAKEFESRFRDTFKKILPRYFESDEKVGVALTGGLDTRMIMAARPETKTLPVCYTFTGPRGKTLDDKIAARVAAACGFEHQLLRLQPDFFTGFAAQADKTVFITDGCSGIFGAHEIYFHQQARRLATMRLTGNYGSEVFRGMSTFKALGLSPQIYNAEFAAAVNATAGKLAGHRKHPDTFTVFKEISWNLFGNLAAGRSQISFRTPYLDNEIVALAYQAPAAEKKTSRPALRLVKACSPALDRIPTDLGFVGDRSGPGVLARRAFSKLTFKLDYYSTAGLPRRLAALNPIFKPVVNGLGIAGMHKFLRYSTWFRDELAGRVREVLSDPQVRGNGIWNPDFLAQIAEQHIGGRNDFSAEINSILTLESVERQFIRGLPRGF
jgi:asparagine synthase (glutamine-hydrolysing)